jgi:hypothetical protein
MLLPFEEFTEDLKKYAPGSLSTVYTLSQRYVASIDATVHRLIDFEDRISCAVVFLTDQKGKFEGDGPLWVKYSNRNRMFRTFIWPGVIPPATSVAIQCHRNGTDTAAHVEETWPVRGEQITWLVQAARLPTIPESPDYPKVVALLVMPPSTPKR